MSAVAAALLDRLRDAAGTVPDPEIPVLTLDDLGIVRDLRIGPDGLVEVDLTPTYSGCPATEAIAAAVQQAVRAAGAERVAVRRVLSPAWSTDWISAEGRRKLREYGIAPPGPGPGRPDRSDQRGSSDRPGSSHRPDRSDRHVRVGINLTARCPRCGSADTREISRFGSTPCKALWSCRACAEPFDAFKAI